MLVHAATDGMRAYFLPPRFYSRHYPYTGVKKKMVRTSIAQQSQLMCDMCRPLHMMLLLPTALLYVHLCMT